MSAQWLRLWHDMPTDPKWRTIARVSGQTISAVIATYIHLLVTASNASERGRTHQANAEDLASALDMETSQIEAILTAMQGRVLDGDILTGWSSRQPEREDGSADRARKWREARKHAAPRDFDSQGSQLVDDERTQANANERKRTQDTDTDTDTDIKSITPLTPLGGLSADETSQPTRPKRQTKPKAAVDLTDGELPAWIPLDDWHAFVDHRRQIKKPATRRAQTMLIDELDRLRQRNQSPSAVLRQSVMRGWAGIFEVKGDGNSTNTGQPRESVVDRIARKNGFVRNDAGEFVRPEEVRDRATILDAHDGALRLSLV